MDHWRQIADFPGYSISTSGQVRKDSSGRILKLMTNQFDIVHAGLFRDGVQYKRSVAVLVVNAFHPPRLSPSCDTPINLDGDRTNNSVDNIYMRPRWFATKYFQQFKEPSRGYKIPIVDIESGEEFKTSWDAAITCGLLEKEIVLSMMNRTFVFPTFQRFRLL
jgi:hypothetical protein